MEPSPAYLLHAQAGSGRHRPYYGPFRLTDGSTGFNAYHSGANCVWALQSPATNCVALDVSFLVSEAPRDRHYPRRGRPGRPPAPARRRRTRRGGGRGGCPGPPPRDRPSRRRRPSPSTTRRRRPPCDHHHPIPSSHRPIHLPILRLTLFNLIHPLDRRPRGGWWLGGLALSSSTSHGR